MIEETNDIQSIHDAYCVATGLTVRLGYDRQSAWYTFLKDGFTKADLLLVISFIQKEIKNKRRWEASLTFRNLIVQIDRFEEDLAMARAHARKPVQSARDKAVQDLRPTAPNQTTTVSITAKPVAAVAAKALADFKKENAKIFGQP